MNRKGSGRLRRRAAGPALAGLLACAGCAPRPAAVPPNPAGWRVSLSAAPAAPRQMDPVRFTVRVTDRGGRQITGARVVVALAMPAMAMGRNEAAAPPAAAGVYTATGRFTMPGDWQATALASKGPLAAGTTISVRVH